MTIKCPDGDGGLLTRQYTSCDRVRNPNL